MVITDSYHNDIEGKDYKYGSPTMIDNKSKPIILYYFLDDYERVWDEGKPISYDDEELKNNASVSLIDYTDNVLLINLFDYESFDEMELKFQVGKETIDAFKSSGKSISSSVVKNLCRELAPALDINGVGEVSPFPVNLDQKPFKPLVGVILFKVQESFEDS